MVNPNKEYCANLGHTFDGESDLIYMRARYYEPATGRFISEDPAADGTNWYVYCSNEPVSRVDENGLEDELVAHWKSKLSMLSGHYLIGTLFAVFAGIIANNAKTERHMALARGLAITSMAVFLAGMVSAAELPALLGNTIQAFHGIAFLALEFASRTPSSHTSLLIGLWFAHVLALCAALGAIDGAVPQSLE